MFGLCAMESTYLVHLERSLSNCMDHALSRHLMSIRYLVDRLVEMP